MPPEPGSREEDKGELPTLIEIPDRTKRRRALAERLARGDTLTAAERRLVVDLAVAVQVNEAPAAAVDVLTALCDAPEAAVYMLAACETLGERNAVLRLQDELPLLWCASPSERGARRLCARRRRSLRTWQQEVSARELRAQTARQRAGRARRPTAGAQDARSDRVPVYKSRSRQF